MGAGAHRQGMSEIKHTMHHPGHPSFGFIDISPCWKRAECDQRRRDSGFQEHQEPGDDEWTAGLRLHAELDTDQSVGQSRREDQRLALV